MCLYVLICISITHERVIAKVPHMLAQHQPPQPGALCLFLALRHAWALLLWQEECFSRAPTLPYSLSLTHTLSHTHTDTLPTSSADSLSHACLLNEAADSDVNTYRGGWTHCG
ncbi:hypothetical protein ILYODFUR_021167 [Ilyodon furcidens]|uniref:Uncharacterized protein n=1 Tax=Ilyodon furcidens TaxID=33524 RepID=A0ABV0V5V5_9TELE